MTAPLLIEIGVEELPPDSMRRLADALALQLSRALHDAGLVHGGVTRYATPRRVAVRLNDMPAQTQPSTVEKAGPTVAIAFDDNGEPTPAALGFARSVGASVAQLERHDSAKGPRLIYREQRRGQPLSDLLQAAMDRVLRALPVAKRMRWGAGDAEFVRPVHWLVALHGRRHLALEAFGVHADAHTYGHRFHYPQAIALAHPDEYAARLYAPGRVIADPDERKNLIIEQVTQAGSRLGGHALIDAALAEEVTALVEWPVGIAARYHPRYLRLPREVLVCTLQGHQRCFPVADDAGDLLAGFVTVANIDSNEPARVVAGNERVVRARLADALFFWQRDRAVGLDAHIDGLARVSFQRELGSLADKSARVARIALRLAETTGTDQNHTARAATLAKTDLLTDMVGEFPDLQGIMGCYYALDSGEDRAVAEALAQQYAPGGAGAPIAASPVGRVLAVADRLDTLAGIFVVGKKPSGDKDPFALRRAALGVLRTLIEAELELDLYTALDYALTLQPVAPDTDTLDDLWQFHVERLRYYYLENGGSADRFDAVARLGIPDVADIDRRLQALSGFVRLPEAVIVCACHKRIRNILQRNPPSHSLTNFTPDYLVEPAEHELADALIVKRDRVDRAVDALCYDKALTELAGLAQPLDHFFEAVMVMTDDAALRQNRLALLQELDQLCTRVADISCLSLG